ncbi:uncharacterized protein LOC135689416 [Rhopilema esculentum]|uniref:uncharacterized protein LOC135689416 n=1 Tax=Rhopilema esculentum TaxID=499914 RepID=UPI0031D75A98
MIEFILLVNKQGQTRLAKYYGYKEQQIRVAMEAEIVRKCLARADNQCSFFEYKTIKIVYRRYASLFFIMGIDNGENELGILEFMHNMVETMDKYFDSVCELDIMFNLGKAHMLIDEMVTSGCIVETNKATVMAPLYALDER